MVANNSSINRATPFSLTYVPPLNGSSLQPTRLHMPSPPQDGSLCVLPSVSNLGPVSPLRPGTLFIETCYSPVPPLPPWVSALPLLLINLRSTPLLACASLCLVVVFCPIRHVLIRRSSWVPCRTALVFFSSKVLVQAHQFSPDFFEPFPRTSRFLPYLGVSFPIPCRYPVPWGLSIPPPHFVPTYRDIFANRFKNPEIWSR